MSCTASWFSLDYVVVVVVACALCNYSLLGKYATPARPRPFWRVFRFLSRAWGGKLGFMSRRCCVDWSKGNARLD
jgi:hypothetical protein